MHSIDRLQNKYRILPSKINRPPLPKGHIPRNRLVDLLNQAQTKQCVVLLAPAGFGKSTLMTEWANQTSLTNLWYSLDELDNELGRFCRYIFVAIRKQFPQLHSHFFEQEENLNTENTNLIASHLVQLLAAISAPAALVLDDCQAITNPLIWQIIEHTLAYLPSNLCLVLGSRTMASLGLGRLKKAGQIQEFDILDIKFSPLETEQFLLCNLPQYSLEQSQQLITKEMSGWVAGLQLSLISHNQLGLTSFVPASVNQQSQRLIQDYLIEEVLKHTDQRILTFLFSTVICRRFSVELANELTSGQDADLIIDQLQRDQLFILPEGTAEPWYRYHSMFRQSLLGIAQIKTPKAVTALHLKAANWWRHRQYYSEAAEHTVSSGDKAALHGFLTQYGWLLYHSNQLHTLQQCFNHLPSATVLNDAPLTLLFCWTLLHEHQDEVARHSLTTATAQALPKSAQRSAFHTLEALFALLRDDAPLALSLVQMALPMLNDDMHWERVHCLLVLTEALQAKGHFRASLESSAQAIRVCTAQAFKTPLAHGHFLVAQAMLALGDLDATDLSLQQALALVDNVGFSRLFSRAALLLCQAKLMIAQAKYVDAGALLDIADAAIPSSNSAWHLPLQTERLKLQLTVLTDLKTLARTAGKLIKARAEYCFRTQWANEADQALLLYCAQTKSTCKIPHTDSQLQTDSDRSAELAPGINRILTLVATNSLSRNSLRAVSALRLRSESLEANLPKLKLRLLSAVCLTYLGQFQPAKEMLMLAIQPCTMKPNLGLLQCYKNSLGLPLLALTDLPEHSAVAGLQFLTRPSKAELIGQRLQARSALLTPKEWSVLALLAERLKNQEIATRLSIQPNTLRSHLKNINRKLQLSGREQAIAQAQALLAQRQRKLR